VPERIITMVTLSAPAALALEKTVELTGGDDDEIINRALLVYAALEEHWSDGDEVQVVSDGTTRKLQVF
jgi:hypothetical protein